MIETINLCKKFSRYEKCDNNGNTDEAENKLKKLFGQGKVKSVKTEFMAVNDVCIRANKGEILGILGPNGAGKTTLLRMMGGLMEPFSGSVNIYDTEDNLITDYTEKKKHVGYLSANTKLYARFSTREMLYTVGNIYGMTEENIEARIKKIAPFLEMEKVLDNRIGNLSTGQMQKANIFRTVIHRPNIYILDEPTLGLDIFSSQAIIDFMNYEKSQNRTVLYSTHYMEEAQYLCDRIVMINDGSVIKTGTPSEIMKDTCTDNLRDAFKAVINGGAENE